MTTNRVAFLNAVKQVPADAYDRYRQQPSKVPRRRGELASARASSRNNTREAVLESARMKFAFWVAFLAVQIIRGAETNTIDRVVAKFSNDPYFRNGLFQPIFMPSNAPPIEVARQTLKNDAPWAATNAVVVDVRQVGITNGEEPRPEDYARLDPKMADNIRAFYARTNYIAILFWTTRGERIVMMQFLPLEDPRDRPGLWWNRAYNPDNILNPRR